MSDLLTHVLVAYVLVTVLSWKYGWITPPYVTVMMAGTTIPDLNRLELIVPASSIEAALGVPFAWNALHTLGGAVTVAAIGALLAPAAHRWRVFGLLCFGIGTHLALDAFLVQPTVHSYPILWPLTGYRPPTVELYRSTDRWPTATALVVATAVGLETRRRISRNERRD